MWPCCIAAQLTRGRRRTGKRRLPTKFDSQSFGENRFDQATSAFVGRPELGRTFKAAVLYR